MIKSQRGLPDCTYTLRMHRCTHKHTPAAAVPPLLPLPLLPFHHMLQMTCVTSQACCQVSSDRQNAVAGARERMRLHLAQGRMCYRATSHPAAHSPAGMSCRPAAVSAGPMAISLDISTGVAPSIGVGIVFAFNPCEEEFHFAFSGAPALDAGVYKISAALIVLPLSATSQRMPSYLKTCTPSGPP